jgi:hypothetical protein
MPRFEARAVAAFRAGYGRAFPEGPDFWLPHVRNLAVVLLTIARRRRAQTFKRALTQRRYLSTIAELNRTVSDIRATCHARARG